MLTDVWNKVVLEISVKAALFMIVPLTWEISAFGGGILTGAGVLVLNVRVVTVEGVLPALYVTD